MMRMPSRRHSMVKILMLILRTRDNDEVAPVPPKNDVNINDNSDDEIDDYEFTPDTPKMAEITK